MLKNELLKIYNKFNNTEYSLYLIVVMALFGNSMEHFRNTYRIQKKTKKQINPKTAGIINFIEQFLDPESKSISKINVNLEDDNPRVYISKILKLLEYYNTEYGEISMCLHDEDIKIKEHVDTYRKKKYNNDKVVTETILIHELSCDNTGYTEKGFKIDKSYFYDLYPEKINLPVSWDIEDYIDFIHDNVQIMNNEDVVKFFEWIMSIYNHDVYVLIRKIANGYGREYICCDTEEEEREDKEIRNIIVDISVYLNNIIEKYHLNGYRENFLTNKSNVLIVPVNKQLKSIHFEIKTKERNFHLPVYEMDYRLCSMMFQLQKDNITNIKYNLVFSIYSNEKYEWYIYEDSKLSIIENIEEYIKINIGNLKFLFYEKE